MGDQSASATVYSNRAGTGSQTPHSSLYCFTTPHPQTHVLYRQLSLETPPFPPFYLFHWRGSALLFEQVTYSGPQKTRFYHSKTLNTRSNFIATALVFGPGSLFLSNQIYLDIRAHLPWVHSITSNLSVYLDLNTLSLVSAMRGFFLRKYGSVIPMTSRYLKDFLWRLKYPKCRPSGEDLRNLFDHYINPIGGVGVWDLLYPTHYFLRIQYG